MTRSRASPAPKSSSTRLGSISSKATGRCACTPMTSRTTIWRCSTRKVPGTASISETKPGTTSGTRPRRLLVGLRREPQVRLQRLPALRELRLCVFVGDCRSDDDVLALLPVDRCRHAVVRGELERVDDAQHLVEVAAGRHRVH